MVKRAERGCVRVAEQIFMTRELMPFRVAELESQVARNISTFSAAKDRVETMRGLAHKIWKQTQNLSSWSSHEQSRRSEITFGWFAFQEEKRSCFKATASPQDSVYHGWDKGKDN